MRYSAFATNGVCTRWPLPRQNQTAREMALARPFSPSSLPPFCLRSCVSCIFLLLLVPMFSPLYPQLFHPLEHFLRFSGANLHRNGNFTKSHSWLFNIFTIHHNLLFIFQYYSFMHILFNIPADTRIFLQFQDRSKISNGKYISFLEILQSAIDYLIRSRHNYPCSIKGMMKICHFLKSTTLGAII